jgi:DNA-binding transcriptional LysR family regulator
MGGKKMDLHHMEAFLMIAQERSFRRAAEMLHITQPAISTRMSQLEKEVKVDLFHREGKSITLSKYGEVLLPYAKRLIALEMEASQSIEDLKKSDKTRLEIGTTSRLGTYLLPALLERFQTLHPQVEIVIETDKSETIIQMLLDGTVHVGLTNAAIQDKSYSMIPIIKDATVLVTSPNDPLYKLFKRNKCITVKDLIQCTIINFKETNYYQPLMDLMNESDIRPNQNISVDNIEAMKRMAMRNLGVAFLPRMSIQRELKEEKLVEIPFPEGNKLTRETYLIFKKRKHLNSTVENFKSIVVEFLSNHNMEDIWE